MWQLPQMSPNEILIYLRKSRTDDPLLSVGEVLAKHEQMLNEWVKRTFPSGGTEPIPRSRFGRDHRQPSEGQGAFAPNRIAEYTGGSDRRAAKIKPRRSGRHRSSCEDPALFRNDRHHPAIQL